MDNQCAHFLGALFPQIPDGCQVEIWRAADKGTARFTALEEAAEWAQRWAEQGDVYVAAALSGVDLGVGRRCPASETAGIGALWADLDVAGDGRHPASVDEARTFASSLALPPTFEIRSGRGLHLWWMFNEPWLFTDDADRTRAATLVRDWINTLGVKASGHGWTLDHVSDLARLMRLPGTTNWKDPSNPLPVSIVAETRWRYDPSDFESFLVVAEPPPTPIEAGAFRVYADAEPSSKFTLLLQMHARLMQTWAHKRPDLQDQTLSSYDMSIAGILMRADFSEQDIVDVLIAHRRKWGDKKNKLRDGYFRITLENARGLIGRSDERSNGVVAVGTRRNALPLGIPEHTDNGVDASDVEDEPTVDDDAPAASAPAADGDDEEAGPSSYLDGDWGGDDGDASGAGALLSDSLGFTIEKFIRYGADPDASYAMQADGQEVHMGQAAALLQLQQFRAKMADLGRTGLRAYSKEDWDIVGTAIIGSCEEAAASPDATYAGRGIGWLISYAAIAIRWESSKVEEIVRSEIPVLRDGYLFAFSGALHKHVTVTMGDRCTPHEMALCLRKAGAVPDVLEIGVGDGKKRTKTTRAGWRVPEALLQMHAALKAEGREPIPDVFLEMGAEKELPF